MERLVFYFIGCAMGLISLTAMLAVYRSNKKVLEDLKHPKEPKDKWTSSFIQEHERLLKENTEIHNPSVYVLKRMRGRKIGPWSIRQIKGISWAAFGLSFFFMGLQIVQTRPLFGQTAALPVLGQVPLMSLFVITGACMGILLLALRLILGMGYQEEVIETNLLDYLENRWKEPSKIIPLENARSGQGKEARAAKKKETPQTAENREKLLQQMEQGIREAAAADSRYSHLLSEDEEAIVKDVIKEFLT